MKGAEGWGVGRGEQETNSPPELFIVRQQAGLRGVEETYDRAFFIACAAAAAPADKPPEQEAGENHRSYDSHDDPCEGLFIHHDCFHIFGCVLREEDVLCNLEAE
jgi:hypothetical protein